MKKTPTPLTVAAWRKAIDAHGSKRIRLRALLKCFGLERRGTGTEQSIKDWLAGLPDGPIFVYGLDGYSRVDLDDSVELADHEMTQIGAFIEAEKFLMERHAKAIMRELGLTLVGEDYCPKGTRDKLDCLCEDASGVKVVVEFKKKDGEKHGVEQVMRYIGHIKAEGHKRVRGILVTGYADPPTRKALQGRHRDDHIDWWVYGIVDGKIRLQQIEIATPARSRSAARVSNPPRADKSKTGRGRRKAGPDGTAIPITTVTF